MSPTTDLRLARVLLESELRETGRTASTGLHLTIPFELLSGLPVQVLAGAFGYSSSQLDQWSASGDGLVMVVARAHADAGMATVKVLAGLMRDLRKEEGPFSDLEVAQALDTPFDRADLPTRQVQEALSRVFGLHDPLFGQPRFPSPQWPDRQIIAPFYIDEKIDPSVVARTRNPLAPGSALALQDYPDLPLVQRLPWPPDEP